MSFIKDRAVGRKHSSSAEKKSRGSGFGSMGSGRALPRIADVADIGPLIDAIINAGDALLFARTSDGGAIVIQLLDNDTKPKAYIVDREQLLDCFQWLEEAYKPVYDAPLASPQLDAYTPPLDPNAKAS